MEFYIHATDEMTPGVYQVAFNDIQLSDLAAAGYRAPDADFTIIVGEPKDEENVKIQGYLSETSVSEINQALVNNEVITELDLTGLKENSADSGFKSANPNMLILCNDKVEVNNKVNTIINEQCEELVLTDGYNFNTSTEFSAIKATYLRNMISGNWETLYLPFTADPVAGISVAELIENLSFEISFSTAEGIQRANEPCLIFTDKAGDYTFEGHNVVISPVNENEMQRFIGTYIAKSNLSNAYLPSGNKENLSFEPGNSIKPFHAYIQLGDGEGITTGVNGILGDKIDEDLLIFTLQGVPVNSNIKDLEEGVYIMNGKKIYIRKK